MSTERFDWMNIAPDSERAPKAHKLSAQQVQVPNVSTDPSLVYALLRNGVEIANHPWRAPEAEYPGYRGD